MARFKRFNQNARIGIEFSNVDKAGIAAVLKKFDKCEVANELANTIAVEGYTVLTITDALILAGLVRPWYPFIADRLNSHPGLFPKAKAQ